MNLRNTTTRYGSLSISMHWLMLLLLVAIYACIELRENFPKGSELREALKTWHYMLGLCVFALVWLRLIFRWIAPEPLIQPPAPHWQMMAAKLMYATLYLFMIGMPLLGWLILSADGKTIPFFGIQFPALVATDEHLAEMLEEIHETVGDAGYFLIGVHALAALYHHYVRRDNTLLRMLPGHDR